MSAPTPYQKIELLCVRKQTTSTPHIPSGFLKTQAEAMLHSQAHTSSLDMTDMPYKRSSFEVEHALGTTAVYSRLNTPAVRCVPRVVAWRVERDARLSKALNIVIALGAASMKYIVSGAVQAPATGIYQHAALQWLLRLLLQLLYALCLHPSCCCPRYSPGTGLHCACFAYHAL